jgi:hypothetical protein
MPMFFWLPAIIISASWSMAWTEVPLRPVRLPKDRNKAPYSGK